MIIGLSLSTGRLSPEEQKYRSQHDAHYESEEAGDDEFVRSA